MPAELLTAALFVLQEAKEKAVRGMFHSSHFTCHPHLAVNVLAFSSAVGIRMPPVDKVTIYQTFSREKRLYFSDESWKEIRPQFSNETTVYLGDRTWWLKRWIRHIGLAFWENSGKKEDEAAKKEGE